ncbi:MAG TPA: heme exporter protein CcmD [Pyrinomonadaceae bacterium]
MNWSEFFSMGGYGLYVWGSYISALIVMGGEVVLLMRRRKQCNRINRDRE